MISGFVITKSLLGRRIGTAGDFVTHFYERRIKRLAPALILCVAVTSILISFFNPSAHSQLVTGMLSLVGMSNIHLYLQAVDYWGESARLNPFTHTWSLGVEEQFYLVYPALLWLVVARVGVRQALPRLIFAIASVCVISFVMFAALHDSEPAAVFYLPMFRAWELGLGCLIAVLPRPRLPILDKIPTTMLLFTLVAALFIPQNYAVLATFTVTVLTTLLIYQNVNRLRQIPLLTNPVALYVGRISYSLYLWHWPVIVLSLWTIGIHWWSWPVQVALIAAMAAASYHYVERPLRYSSWTKLRELPKAPALAVLAALAVVPLVYSNAASSRLYLGSRAVSSPVKLETLSIACGSARGTKLRPIGNSHSRRLNPVLNALAEKCGVEALSNQDALEVNYPDGTGINVHRARRAMAPLGPGDVLILLSRYFFLYDIPYLSSNGDLAHWQRTHREKIAEGYGLDSWLLELDDLLEKAQQRGIQTVLILPNVEFDSADAGVPQDLCSDQWFRLPSRSCDVSVTRSFLDRRFPERWFEEVAERERKWPNLHVFDPLPVYCPQTTCNRMVQGVNAFKDTHHLSPRGAMLMLEPFAAFLAQAGLLDGAGAERQQATRLSR